MVTSSDILPVITSTAWGCRSMQARSAGRPSTTFLFEQLCKQHGFYVRQESKHIHMIYVGSSCCLSLCLSLGIVVDMHVHRLTSLFTTIYMHVAIHAIPPHTLKTQSLPSSSCNENVKPVRITGNMISKQPQKTRHVNVHIMRMCRHTRSQSDLVLPPKERLALLRSVCARYQSAWSVVAGPNIAYLLQNHRLEIQQDLGVAKQSPKPQTPNPEPQQQNNAREMCAFCAMT